MGILDRWRKAAANPKAALPLPVSQSRDVYLTGYGSGQLQTLLRRALPGSSKDWARVAGDLGLNSIIAVGIDWYVRNYPQATLKYYRPVDSQQADTEDHPVLKLIAQPDPTITAGLFWGWVIQDYKLFGNTYIKKIRGTSGTVTALQYLPQDMVRPVGNGLQPLTHYVYTTDGRSFQIPLEDIIHIRYGREPSDIRLGRSPIQAVLREIATDNTASSTAWGLLSNGATPSLIVGPDSKDQAVDISIDDARQVKRQLHEDLTGDGSGGIVVMTGAYKMDRVSLTPSELALDSVRRVPEERICSALGLNPMVLGLGSGLERSTYSNYERAQQAAWEDGMVPMLRVLSDAITASLLPEYPETQEGDYVAYDLETVRALADDLVVESERAERLYKAGIIDRAEAKRISGVEAQPEDEGILHPTAIPVQNAFPDAPAKSFDTKFVPNQAMRDAAQRALDWKAEGRAGGTRVGLARANQIVNGDKLSEETILRMYSFFSRHEVDKEAEGFSAGEDGYPSAGRVAWDLWGGDAGFAWSRSKRNQMQGDDSTKSEHDGCCTPGVVYKSHPFYGYELEAISSE